MGIASAWGRVGAVAMLLVFGHLFAILGKSLLFLMIDPVLIVAAIVVLCFDPSTRGKPQNKKKCPLRGSHDNRSRTRPYSPSNPLRMSVTPAAR